MIQHLLHSKVAKAESYLIGGYHNEWLELTYYIETLVYSSVAYGTSQLRIGVVFVVLPGS